MMIQHDAITWFADFLSTRNHKNVAMKTLPLRESRHKTIMVNSKKLPLLLDATISS